MDKREQIRQEWLALLDEHMNKLWAELDPVVKWRVLTFYFEQQEREDSSAE